MPTVKTGLSRKLLTRVLSVYFILTLLVTVGQILTEYVATKHHIETELRTLKSTFSTSLTRAIWELNLEQAKVIADGLLALPIVEGVQIRDENGQYIFDQGVTISQPKGSIEVGVLRDHPGGVFGYSFPLIFEFSGRASKVGDVTLYSNFGIIFGRIEVGVFFLIGNAILKTAFLVFLFLNAFRQMLTEPLSQLTRQMKEFDPENPQSSKLHAVTNDDNELHLLQTSYNTLIDVLATSQNELKGTQQELSIANKKLDEQKLLLEKEVAKKTAYLSKIMLDLEQQKEELVVKQQQLRQENENRQYIEEELRKRNDELAASMRALEIKGDQLIEIERTSALIPLFNDYTRRAHTPLSAAVNEATLLSQQIDELASNLADPGTKLDQHKQVAELQQQVNQLQRNLAKTESVSNASVAISKLQHHDVTREVEFKDYIGKIARSLAPSLAAAGHKMHIQCPPGVVTRCHAGALAQLLQSLVNNSITHGFDEEPGNIWLNVSSDEQFITLDYRDDGKGASEERMANLFSDNIEVSEQPEKPSGVGLLVLRYLITNELNGSVSLNKEVTAGLGYIIQIPLSH